MAQSRAAMRPCRDVEIELLAQLRGVISEPPTSRHCGAVLSIVVALLDNLWLLELARGPAYLSEVLEIFPNWDRRVRALHRENVACHASIEELHRRVGQEPPTTAVPDTLRGDISTWIESLVAHRRDETLLFHTALTLDIGGEG
jgi:hypothetical protein